MISKEEDKREDNRGVDDNKDYCKEVVIEEGKKVEYILNDVIKSNEIICFINLNFMVYVLINKFKI